MTDGRDESARFWKHPGLPGVELLKARYVQHTFSRHVHETYTIAVIESGIEEYAYRGATHRVGPGGIAVVEPDEVHTGHAGIPEGWRYRVLYPEVAVVTEVARDLGLPDVPAFSGTVLTDPATAGTLRNAHQASEHGDRLSASTLTRQALHLLLARHTRSRPQGPARTAGPTGSVAAARDLLRESLVDPPRLEDLAEAVGARPYPLLRAFRASFGLPPHSYVTQVRVSRARRLLRDGAAPAEVAIRVGFADQPHLTRHFKRHMGVTPGAYQRGIGRAGA
ncbi:AraC-like DNA-binding protein [Lipingzhangella halophila]|uniref:AraC-like DNA-binding protein n=1 Tax=Lipingzhangella halophila TaxID=1783352 RepID=A0A7W7RGF6_9ACTN|nr:AraC family transcriptional regulator [Lipingzhangella halophila]MBB4930971.1 AraC-like DNA-binding protein [Lipingzhangella halophila]